jgi:hypothetical protein
MNMTAQRIEATVSQSGTLTLADLPPGQPVEVIVLVREAERTPAPSYPLRGLPVEYHDPTEPVAAGDWEADQ